MTPKLMIGTPAKPPYVHVKFLVSLLDSLSHLAARNVDTKMAVVSDCPLVGHARARLVASFMSSDCTHLLMIDSDTSWDIDAPFRMLNHGLPLVGAVAADKQTERLYVGKLADVVGQGAATVEYDTDTELLSVDRCGCCFLMIRRDCIETMVATHRRLKVDDGSLPFKDQPWFYGFFEMPVIDGSWPSEDFRFCDLYREAGGKVFVDPWIALGHHVSKHLEGRLIDHLPFEDNWQPAEPAPLAQEEAAD